MSGHTPWAQIKREALALPREMPDMLRPVPGETSREARQRRELNRIRRSAWRRYWSELCAVRGCNQTRSNVIHEQDPEHSPEGADYFADFLDQLHAFVPSGKWGL